MMKNLKFHLVKVNFHRMAFRLFVIFCTYAFLSWINSYWTLDFHFRIFMKVILLSYDTFNCVNSISTFIDLTAHVMNPSDDVIFHFIFSFDRSLSLLGLPKRSPYGTTFFSSARSTDESSLTWWGWDDDNERRRMFIVTN